MSQLTPEQLGDLASLNSVSRGTLVSEGVYENDFTGNDLAFAHTTEETERKKFTTLAELSDQVDEAGDLVDLAPKAEAEEEEETPATPGDGDDQQEATAE